MVLRLCLGVFRTSPVERVYADTHGPKLSLQYASKIISLPNHPTYEAVFDNNYMRLFDAWRNAIYGLC